MIGTVEEGREDMGTASDEARAGRPADHAPTGLGDTATIASASEIEAKREQLHALRAQVEAHDNAKRKAEHERLLGRCFKYRNSYGDGGSWWLYIKVVAIGDYWPYALKFQTCVRGEYTEFRLEVRDLITGLPANGRDGSGYIEIPRSEFDDALTVFFNAQAIEARRAETAKLAQPEGQEPDPKGCAK